MTIDDSFRSFPDLNRPKDTPAPLACCPRDQEPLICTMERRGAEFHCMICGGWFGFLAPVPGDYESNKDRHSVLKERFNTGERGPIS